MTCPFLVIKSRSGFLLVGIGEGEVSPSLQPCPPRHPERKRRIQLILNTGQVFRYPLERGSNAAP